ncbi:MAG TPA: pantoate--beta-alanine ligase [Acidimicrobiales bacterium]|nr:pantoate--beta-alanine ligase [Acidimicrobiales bacterium]
MTEVVASLTQWRERTAELRAGGATIGLTMTMGALHAGHVSLFERARAECDVALATIFVNPLQFNDPADFAAYRLNLTDDLEVARRAGVTAVLVPSTDEMWPRWPSPSTTIHVADVVETLEGADRPGHFDGVATVVAKLLVLTGACVAYFGEKDYQQLCVVRRVVEDLSLAAEIVGCPIVREDDGVALSSRNARLSDHGRVSARALHRALRAGRDALERGETVRAATAAMWRVGSDEPDLLLAYAAAVDPDSLGALSEAAAGARVRLLIAGAVEGVRLLDNLEAEVGRG